MIYAKRFTHNLNPGTGESHLCWSDSNPWEKKTIWQTRSEQELACALHPDRDAVGMLSMQMWNRGTALPGAFLFLGDDGVRDEASGRKVGV